MSILFNDRDREAGYEPLVVTVLAALAQMEREQIASRTRTAMAELRRQGRKTSSEAPFGYRFEGDRGVEVASEQGILARIEALDAQGLGCVRSRAPSTRRARTPG